MSGTFNGRRVGYQPYLRLTWKVLRQETAGNRSLVRLQLTMVNEYSLWFSPKTGVLNGSSFSVGSYSGSSNRVLHTRDIWVGHNADGTKKVTFTGSLNLNGVTFSGTNIGNLTVNGTATLPAIARGSTASGISATEPLKPYTGTFIRFGINSKVSAYEHYVAIRDGSTILVDWYSLKGGSVGNMPLDREYVDKILSHMRTTTKKKFTFRVSTYHPDRLAGDYTASNWVGTIDYEIEFSVDGTVVPEIIEKEVKIDGNGYDSRVNKYVQNVSKILSRFRSNSRGGAGVKERKISVYGHMDELTGGGINGLWYEYKTATLRTGGQKTVEFSITDTRGRTTKESIDIYVEYYSPPRITNLGVGRDFRDRLAYGADVEHSPVSGSNETTVTVTARSQVDQHTVQIDTYKLTSESTKNIGRLIPGMLSDAHAYDFEVVAVDKFGNRASSLAFVPTAQTFIAFREDWGVGVGMVPSKHGLSVFEDIHIGELEVPIVDSGSNANGRWVKFYDGTLICMMKSKAKGGGTAYGALYYRYLEDRTLTFPQTFVERPAISYTSSNTNTFFTESEVSNTRINLPIAYTMVVASNLNTEVSIVAIGRWK